MPDNIKAVLKRLLLEDISPQLRHAIAVELGISLQRQQRDAADKKMEEVKRGIEKIKARMRSNGERPRGGIHQAALDETAERRGIDPERLAQQIKRYNRREREGLEDLAEWFGIGMTHPLIAQIRDRASWFGVCKWWWHGCAITAITNMMSMAVNSADMPNSNHVRTSTTPAPLRRC